MAHLVLFETGGNQRFIFATNKLAENLGASQMIWDAGVRLVLEEVERKTGRKLFDDTPRITRANLRNEPPLGAGPHDIEVVTAASGKAILLVNDAEIGRDLVYEVTKHCLQTLAGLDLRGVVGREFELGGANLDEEMRAVHERLAALNGMLPGPEFRSLRLPVIAACATSNLPASRVDSAAPDAVRNRPETWLRSEASWQKRRYSQRARDRLCAGLDLDGAAFRLPLNLDELERLPSGVDWLAVIHADGNGVGAVFQNFGEKARATNSREYLDRLRRFSLALDDCTEKAAGEALENAYRRKARKDGTLAAVPLVLGGDDLTLVCDGRIALRTTHYFLATFANEARTNPDIVAVMTGTEPLTASAGVAIVKPHFPFHLAYELAEALLRSAKRKKREAAIDFLVHYDASGGELRQIRDRSRVGDAQLYARPYAIGGDWKRFAKAVETLNGEPDAAVRATEDEEPIPRSLLHELRSALFLGRDAGEQQLQWALARRGAGDERLRSVLEALHGEEKLFQRNPDQNDSARDPDRPEWRSALLDVLEAQEFWR